MEKEKKKFTEVKNRKKIQRIKKIIKKKKKFQSWIFKLSIDKIKRKINKINAYQCCGKIEKWKEQHSLKISGIEDFCENEVKIIPKRRKSMTWRHQSNHIDDANQFGNPKKVWKKIFKTKMQKNFQKKSKHQTFEHHQQIIKELTGAWPIFRFLVLFCLKMYYETLLLFLVFFRETWKNYNK